MNAANIVQSLGADRKVSNRVTGLLGISLDAPASVVLDDEIKRLPETRTKELERLSAELERQYVAARSEQKKRLSQEEDKLAVAKSDSANERGDLQDEIRDRKNSIEWMSGEIERLTVQSKKDLRVIRWMYAWKITWGILCTAGAVIVIGFLIIGFLFKVISFFMPKSDDD